VRELHDGPVRADEQAAYEAVRVVAARTVPVVGAGLAAGAGAPSAATLGAALTAELEAAGGGPAGERASLFDLADRLAAVRGADAVTRLVAAHCQGPFTATSTLLALVHVPGGRIVTTNYDEAIEHAAPPGGAGGALIHPGNDQRVPPAGPRAHRLRAAPARLGAGAGRDRPGHGQLPAGRRR